jgi:hypothetical protein
MSLAFKYNGPQTCMHCQKWKGFGSLDSEGDWDGNCKINGKITKHTHWCDIKNPKRVKRTGN